MGIFGKNFKQYFENTNKAYILLADHIGQIEEFLIKQGYEYKKDNLDEKANDKKTS